MTKSDLDSAIYGWGSPQRLAQGSRTYDLTKLITSQLSNNFAFIGTPVKTIFCSNEFIILTSTSESVCFDGL